MYRTFFLVILFFIVYNSSHSQDKALYQSLIISDELKQSANAIVRYDDIDIEVVSFDKIIYRNKRIVTILNKKGNSKHGAVAGYDDNTTIVKLEAKIFDASGKEIKKIKKKNFTDESAVSGGTLYSDSRVKYLEYIPFKFPYTVEFYTEIEYNSTAFFPGWRPIDGFYISTQNASYTINNKSDVELKIKTTNFDDFNITKQSDFNYSATNLKALKPEAYSPIFRDYAPFLKVALVDFEMEGVRGKNKDWKDFGKWIHDKLLADTQDIPESVKAEVRELTANATTAIEKAKIVYQYMQGKTRYISVQIGIGGWKPMLAEDVNRLGYGDCKGLTNYTKALLKEVGVESYYTVLYAGDRIRDIEADFSATSGNHAILCLPNNDDYIWLECTSQTAPFGHNANFSDDRDVLVVTPEGGKIVHTRVYEAEENKLVSQAEITLTSSGDIHAKIHSSSFGTQYDYHENIQRKSEKDKKLHYKNYWDYINNLDVEIMALKDNKDVVVFEEELEVKVIKYASKAGKRLLVKPNAFNISEVLPRNYKNRKWPVNLDRGFLDEDTYIFTIPESLKLEAMFDPVEISTKYGDYSCSVKMVEGKLEYKRKLKVNKGLYTKEEYKQFRDFWVQVNKYDNAKIVLSPI